MTTYLEQGNALVRSESERKILKDADLAVQGKDVTKRTTCIGSVVAFSLYILNWNPNFFLIGTAVSAVACLVFSKEVQTSEPKAQALITRLKLESKPRICPRPCPPACPPLNGMGQPCY